MSITLFLTSFTFIFLAATPGRTTFLLILLASQERLKKVFVGAAAAFLIQSLISVLLGEILGFLPKVTIELLAGFMFLYFGHSFWKQSKTTETFNGYKKSLSIRSVFIMVFMAEFADVSQLAIATTAARSSSKLVVFVSAVSSLWLLTAVALIFGHTLKRFIKPHLIQKVASIAFLGIGLFLLLNHTVSRFID